MAGFKVGEQVLIIEGEHAGEVAVIEGIRFIFDPERGQLYQVRLIESQPAEVIECYEDQLRRFF